MNDAEEIKRKKFEELQRQQQESLDDNNVQEQINQLESSVKTLLTKKAIERYGNIKIAHPEIAFQLLVLLGQAINTGRIEKVDDEALKNLLERIQPRKNKFKITRK